MAEPSGRRHSAASLAARSVFGPRAIAAQPGEGNLPSIQLNLPLPAPASSPTHTSTIAPLEPTLFCTIVSFSGDPVVTGVRAALSTVELVFEPLSSPEKMSDDMKLLLGLYG